MIATSFILDIETLSTVPNSVVFDVAVLAVERGSFEIIDTLGLSLNIAEQIAAGRVTDADTIKFHMDRNGIPAHTAGVAVAQAIAAIWAFFERFKPVHVWIQGPDFDRPILESLFRQYGMAMPWKYSATRDSRTVWDVAFPGAKKPLPPHQAMDDCLGTLENIQAALTALGRPEAF
jgi:hypothetical protein